MDISTRYIKSVNGYRVFSFFGTDVDSFYQHSEAEACCFVWNFNITCNMSDSNEIQTSVLGVLDFSEPVSLNYSFA